MNATLIDTLLVELLDVAADVLTPNGGSGDPRLAPPAMQGIRHGAFAWDCEMLVTHMQNLTLERPAGQPSSCAISPVATLAVTLLRCYPEVGDSDDVIPDNATITTAATQLAVDAAALATGLADALVNGDLFTAFGCKRVTFTPGVDPLGPSGGFAGWRLALSVRL